MNVNDLAGWLLLALPIFSAAGGLIGAALMKNWKPARDVVVYAADYEQAIEEAVAHAERYGVANALPGFDKLKLAVKRMDEWFDAMGIQGDAKRVTMEKVRADIELAVAAARKATTGRTGP